MFKGSVKSFQTSSLLNKDKFQNLSSSHLREFIERKKVIEKKIENDRKETKKTLTLRKRGCNMLDIKSEQK